MDQHLFLPEGSVSDTKGQGTWQTSAELARAYDAQTREIAEAIGAAVINAQAGLNWLGAQPRDLEEVRRVLNCIARDGKRAGEMVVQLRSLMNGWNS
jgi:hypothetical protein